MSLSTGLSPGLPTGSRGRLLALGIAALLLALLWLGAVAPLLDWHAARGERLTQRTALAERMAAVAGTLPQRRRDAAAGTGTPPALLAGASDAVAGAALQGGVQEMAARAGVTLASAELLPAEPAGRYRRIGLRLSVNGPYAALLGMLREMEEATPRMLVDDLSVRNAPSLGAGARQPISAGLTVVAFRAGDDPVPR